MLMFFSKKEKKEKKSDVADIKEAMEPVPERPPEYNEAPAMPGEKDFAPLFVKVDKYKETLASLQEMKVFVSGIKQLFNIMHDIDTIRVDALKIMKATTMRLERNLLELDGELLRPKGFDLAELEHGEVEIHNIEDSLSDLQKQLSGLRKELQEWK